MGTFPSRCSLVFEDWILSYLVFTSLWGSLTCFLCLAVFGWLLKMIPLEEDVNFLLEYPPGRLMLFATKGSNISVCHWHHAMKGWHTKKQRHIVDSGTYNRIRQLCIYIYIFIHHLWLEEGGSFQDCLFHAKAWLFHNIRTFEGLLAMQLNFQYLPDPVGFTNSEHQMRMKKCVGKVHQAWL